MKYLLSFVLAAVSAIFVISCDEEAPSPYVEQLVVDGFLYIGSPLQVKLSHTVEFDQAYYPDSVRVDSAEVCVVVDGHTYALTEANSGIPGTYSAPADSHLVQSGKTYYLMIMNSGYPDLHATCVAAPDLHLTGAYRVTHDQSAEVLETNPDTIEYGSEFLQLDWNEDPSVFAYTFLIENLETEKYGEPCDMGDDNGPGSYVSLWTYRFGYSLVMPEINYCYTGRYQIRVFSCDYDGWNYFNTTVPQDFENRPVTNLSSGMGIFCAVGCDTFNFALTDTLED
jgi:hypothetical protein